MFYPKFENMETNHMSCTNVQCRKFITTTGTLWKYLLSNIISWYLNEKNIFSDDVVFTEMYFINSEYNVKLKL